MRSGGAGPFLRSRLSAYANLRNPKKGDSPHFQSCALVAVAMIAPGLQAQGKHQNALIDLWMQGKPAFGVFVPNENAPPPRPAGMPRPRRLRPSGGPGGGGNRPKPLYTKAGGEKLAANPLYDFVFLNLEGATTAKRSKAIAEGLRASRGSGRKSLIVRVPAFHEDPAAGRVAHPRGVRGGRRRHYLSACREPRRSEADSRRASGRRRSTSGRRTTRRARRSR